MPSVAINGKFYAGNLNGVHRVADRLVRELDDLIVEGCTPGTDFTLFCTNKCDWVPQLKAIRIIRDVSAPSQRWEQWRLPRLASGSLLVNLANLAPLLHRNQIVLIHDMQFLMKDSGYPIRQRIGYRLLVPRMARASRKVLTVSAYSRQMLDFMGVAPAERTEVLYNGADHLPYDSSDGRAGLTPPDRPYVLMFASPKSYKNNQVVFSAFEGSVLDDFDLVLVGASREQMERAGLRSPPRTRFAGACDDEKLVQLYRHAHCFVFPSRTEGFGLPPVEAMLAKCPVVVSPAGAIPEVCRDGALYADVDRPESWAEAIIALKSPSLRASKIALGSNRASAFTWKRSGRSLLDHILATSAHA